MYLNMVSKRIKEIKKIPTPSTREIFYCLFYNQLGIVLKIIIVIIILKNNR